MSPITTENVSIAMPARVHLRKEPYILRILICFPHCVRTKRRAFLAVATMWCTTYGI
jgi:hypothetical protein